MHEPPLRETADAEPLPTELQARLNKIEQQDVSPAGRAALATSNPELSQAGRRPEPLRIART
jgi:hypothetical protein